jgi:hypothetical protein
MHTLAPSAAKLSAIAFPIPEAPPVMNTNLSLKELIFFYPLEYLC